jgi:hypothetical protein
MAAFGTTSPCAQVSTGMTARRPQRSLSRRAGNGSSCPLAAIRALAACTFKTLAFTDFALFNHLIRAGAAVAGCADLEAADFPVKLAPGYMGAD